MSNRTPGPWELHGQGTPGCGGAGPHDWVIVGGRYTDEDGDEAVTVVAHVKGNPTAGDIPYQNARLIAAAPDLLAACRAVLAAADSDEWHDMASAGSVLDRLSEAFDAAREAVAKAEGGGPC